MTPEQTTAQTLTFTPLAPSAQIVAFTAQNNALKAQVATLEAQLRAHAAPAPIALGQPYTNATGRGAYAHVQMSCLVAGAVVNPAAADGSGQGASMSVLGCVAAIREMRAMGFDGASLDLGGADFAYLQSVTNMFAGAAIVNAENLISGAQQVNSRAVGKFSLFLTIDGSNASLEAPGVISGLLLRFCHDPAYLLVKDAQGQMRPRLSTYAGGGGTWAAVNAIYAGELARCRAAGVSPFFIAGFELTNADGSGAPYTPQTCAAYVQGLLAGLADGYWGYGSQESPLATSGGTNYLSPVLQQQVMAQAVKAAGLWSEGTAKCQVIYSNARFYSECYGPEALNAYAQLLLTPGLFDSLQFVTYNDYGEGTGVSNLDPGPGGVWPYVFQPYILNTVEGYWKTKLGLQDLLNTLLQPFKTGQSIAYSRDDLYVAYIGQTADMVATGDPQGQYLYFNTDGAAYPDPAAALPDQFFVRLDLVAAAVLVISQNGVAFNRFAPAGTSYHRVAKQASTTPFPAPQFAVVRNGVITVNVAGTPVVGPNNPSLLNSLNYAWHSGHSS